MLLCGANFFFTISFHTSGLHPKWNNLLLCKTGCLFLKSFAVIPLSQTGGNIQLGPEFVPFNFKLALGVSYPPAASIFLRQCDRMHLPVTYSYIILKHQ